MKILLRSIFLSFQLNLKSYFEAILLSFQAENGTKVKQICFTFISLLCEITSLKTLYTKSVLI